MDFPKINFTTNTDQLAHHLCYLAKQISCRYYQDRRFLILPKPLNFGRSVCFPGLKYTPNFWNSLKNLTQNDHLHEFPKSVKLASQLLSENSLLPASQDQVLQHEIAWQAKEKPFFAFLKEFLPSYRLDQIESIDCLVSPFGTMGTFHFTHLPNGKYKFHLVHRAGLDSSHLAEGILSTFFLIDNPTVTLTSWENREAIIDFLMTKTKLAAIFEHQFTPTTTDLPEIATDLVAESENYLARLGFPIKPVLSIRHSGQNPESFLCISDEIVYNTFTSSEKHILTGLIENKNTLLTYDDIANLFWGEEQSLEKFSFQSIAKIMEKIRKKIKNHRVYQELIYTVRGEGYVLYD